MKLDQLKQAVQEGNIEILRKGLNAHKRLIKERDEFGMTLLHWACFWGRAEAVELCIRSGADINACDDDGNPSIFCAVQEGYAEIVSQLLNSGSAIDCRGGQENTLLHVAAREGHAELCSKLIGMGADVNARCEGDNQPIHLAAMQAKSMSVEVLLKYGADVDARNALNATALHYSAHSDDYETAKLLLDAGADISVRDIYGRDPSTIAVNRHSEKVWGLLAKCNEDVLKTAGPKQIPTVSGQVILGEAQHSGVVLEQESLGFVPELFPIVSDMANALTKEIWNSAGPKGISFANLKNASFYISTKAVEAAILWLQSSDGKVSVVFSQEDYHAGRSGVSADPDQVQWINQFLVSTVEPLFFKYQEFCVQELLAKQVDLFAEVQNALSMFGMIAVHSALNRFK